MADFLKAFLKASRLARKGRPFSAAAVVARAFPAVKPARKAASKAGRKQTALTPALRRPSSGSFITGAFECSQGNLAYKLYTPKGSAKRRMPLVVMLHGCAQTATDFARGTDMNRLADELGFIVLYPQQGPSANPGRCWNWHSPAHQLRGSGEPAVIAALTRHAMALTRANPSRIYVAGLSAGGATAAIMGATYPDLFVAVGIHSGVAQGQVRSLATALSAMRGQQQPTGSRGKLRRPLPTIVFHGDSDRTVHPSNAQAFLANLERSRPGPLVSQHFAGTSPGGRAFTRKVYRTASGTALLEDWAVHGSGHGWSGGRATGSYTDPAGPDASREMLRFFLARRREE